jgi:membrane carboxypeptidase/penicillin-binding protein
VDPNAENHFSPQLVQMTIAVIEPDFWQSPGYDWNTILNPEPATIAEKLVFDLLLSDEPVSPERAIRMRILASQAIEQYGHSQVLSWYLNSTYYGHQAYGADSAAQLYLGKSAADLDTSESILLAVVSLAPALNPLDAPAAALERHTAALWALLDAKIIGQAEFDYGLATPLVFQDAPDTPESPAPAFVNLVLNQATQALGRSRIERGGLKIITTLDMDLQAQTACATQYQLARLSGHSDLLSINTCEAARLLPMLNSMPLTAGELSSTTAILDPAQGQVLALLGETTFEQTSGQLTAHAPGSLMSPFVAVSAFARGLAPASLVWDISSDLPEAIAGFSNPDGRDHGPERLRTAIANDHLLAVSKILTQIGSRNVWRQVEPFGFRDLSLIERPDTLLFNGGNTTTLDIASAYAVFANLGIQVGESRGNGSALSPISILSIEDEVHTLLYQSQAQKQAIISPQLGYLVHDMLSDNTTRWQSLGYPNALEIGRPASAKIGQIAGQNAVWTAGYTPNFSMAVWVGANDGSLVEPEAAMGIWHALMKYAGKNIPADNWTQPEGLSSVNVCDPSGLKPTIDCPTTVMEIFLSGSEPVAYDALYQTFEINRETGLLATVFTPPELIEEETFLVVPTDLKSWAAASDLPQPPSEYDLIQMPLHNPDANIAAPEDFSIVSGAVEITGTAGGQGFLSYRLQVGEGINPRLWKQIGSEESDPVNEDILATWETGEDGLYAVRLVVLRENQNIDIITTQVTVDNTPPEIKLVYPTAESRFSLRDTQEMIWRAEVADVIGIERVEWVLDGEVIGTTRQDPYGFSWILERGNHTLTAVAYDLAGNVSESGAIEFSVTR